MNDMAQGLRAGFEGTVAEHEGAVLRICRSILGDDHLGADAAQETFLRLWRRLNEDRAPATPGPWLRRVAVSTSLDAVRSRLVRDDSIDANLREADHEDVADLDQPDRGASRNELDRHLEAAMRNLPEGQRTVFQLRHFGNLSLREVAETLDLALPTVKTQFARACLRLQSTLAPHRPEESRS